VGFLGSIWGSCINNLFTCGVAPGQYYLGNLHQKGHILRHNKPDINRKRYLGIPASLTATLGSLNGLLFQWWSVLWFGLQVRDLCGNDKTASVMSRVTLEGATTMTHLASVISWSNVVDQARRQSFCFALHKAPKDAIQAAAIAHFCQFGETMPKY
jgi:hypothetical protein